MTTNNEALKAAIDKAVETHGLDLAVAMLRAAADTLPPSLLDSLAMALSPFSRRYAMTVRKAAVTALSASDFPMKPGAWDTDSKALFIKMLDQFNASAPSSAGDKTFTTLVRNFGLICRGMHSSDCLTSG